MAQPTKHLMVSDLDKMDEGIITYRVVFAHYRMFLRFETHTEKLSVRLKCWSTDPGDSTGNVGMILVRGFTIINPSFWRPKFWPILNLN